MDVFFRFNSMAILALFFIFGVLHHALPATNADARIHALHEAREQDPDNIGLALQLSVVLQAAGRDEESRRAAAEARALLGQQMEHEGETAQGHYLMGVAALLMDRPGKAVESMRRAVELAPERENAHSKLAQALLDAGKEDEALDVLHTARALFPESDTVKRALAGAYSETGRVAEAIPFLEDLEKRYPDDRGLFDELLAAYIEVGDAESAAVRFDRLVEESVISPLEREIHLVRLYLQHGNMREARRVLQNAVRIEADHPAVKEYFRQYYAALAGEAVEEGNDRRAFLFLERALEFAPDHQETRLNLAVVHARGNRHEEALEIYRELLEERPTNPAFYGHFAISLVNTGQVDLAEHVHGLGQRLLRRNPDWEAEQILERAEWAIRDAKSAASLRSGPWSSP